MKKRVAKKILKRKDLLNYSEQQIEKARQLIEKKQPKPTREKETA